MLPQASPSRDDSGRTAAGASSLLGRASRLRSCSPAAARTDRDECRPRSFRLSRASSDRDRGQESHARYLRRREAGPLDPRQRQDLRAFVAGIPPAWQRRDDGLCACRQHRSHRRCARHRGPSGRRSAGVAVMFRSRSSLHGRGPLLAAPIRLSFAGLAAIVPHPCGQWPKDLSGSGTREGIRTSNTGISAAPISRTSRRKSPIRSISCVRMSRGASTSSSARTRSQSCARGRIRRRLRQSKNKAIDQQIGGGGAP